jgi:hypothetical protein
MLGQLIFDPTAGESARLRRELPATPLPILDPTNPGYGLEVPERDRGGIDARPDYRRPARRPVVEFDA